MFLQLCFCNFFVACYTKLKERNKPLFYNLLIDEFMVSMSFIYILLLSLDLIFSTGLGPIYYSLQSWRCLGLTWCKSSASQLWKYLSSKSDIFSYFASAFVHLFGFYGYWASKSLKLSQRVKFCMTVMNFLFLKLACTNVDQNLIADRRNFKDNGKENWTKK